MRYVFKSGLIASFVNYKYRTNKPVEIDELDYELSIGNPNIYVKPGEKVVDTKNDDPMIGLKQKIIQDYLAEQEKLRASAVDSNRDFGGTSNPPDTFGALNSGNIVKADPKSVKAAVAGMPNIVQVKSKEV